MPTRLFLLVPALAAFLAAAPARAVPVTFGFTGTVDFAAGSVEGEAVLPFGIGDTISGSYTFDSEIDNFGGIYFPITSAEYSVGTMSVALDFGNDTAVCNPVLACAPTPTFAPWETTIQVAGGQPNGSYLALALQYATGLPQETLVFEIELLDDGVGEALPNDDLPLVPPDLANFDQSVGGSFRWRTAPEYSSTDYTGFFTLDSLYLVPIPEPGTGLLLGGGLLALALGRRR